MTRQINNLFNSRCHLMTGLKPTVHGTFMLEQTKIERYYLSKA